MLNVLFKSIRKIECHPQLALRNDKLEHCSVAGRNKVVLAFPGPGKWPQSGKEACGLSEQRETPPKCL